MVKITWKNSENKAKLSKIEHFGEKKGVFEQILVSRNLILCIYLLELVDFCLVLSKKAIEAITNLIWLHNHILGGNLHDFRVAHGTENM